MIGYTNNSRLVPFAIRLKLPDKNLDGIVFTSPDRFLFTLMPTVPPPLSAPCYRSFANTHFLPRVAFDDKCDIQFMAESSLTSSISYPGIAMGAVIRHAKWSQTTSPTAR